MKESKVIVAQKSEANAAEKRHNRQERLIHIAGVAALAYFGVRVLGKIG